MSHLDLAKPSGQFWVIDGPRLDKWIPKGCKNCCGWPTSRWQRMNFRVLMWESSASSASQIHFLSSLQYQKSLVERLSTEALCQESVGQSGQNCAMLLIRRLIMQKFKSDFCSIGKKVLKLNNNFGASQQLILPLPSNWMIKMLLSNKQCYHSLGFFPKILFFFIWALFFLLSQLVFFIVMQWKYCY